MNYRHIYICVCTYTYIYAYVYVYVHTHIYICMSMYACVYIYIHTYFYISLLQTSLLFCYIQLHWRKWIFSNRWIFQLKGTRLSSLNRKCNGDLNLLPSMESVTFSSSILICWRGRWGTEGERELYFFTYRVASVIVMLVTMCKRLIDSTGLVFLQGLQ